MAGKLRRSASVGWYWRSSPSYLGSAGGAHGRTEDGGGSSRANAIPMITKNCVPPMKEIFTRTSRNPRDRFITYSMTDGELKCRAQTVICSFLLSHLFLKLLSADSVQLRLR